MFELLDRVQQNVVGQGQCAGAIHAGKAYWVGQLTSETLTRAGVYEGFLTSTEFKERTLSNNWADFFEVAFPDFIECELIGQRCGCERLEVKLLALLDSISSSAIFS